MIDSTCTPLECQQIPDDPFPLVLIFKEALTCDGDGIREIGTAAEASALFVR